MSRRALEHKQDKERARAAALAAEGIVPAEPPEVDPEGCLPYKCNRVTMDMGHVLHSNICESVYVAGRGTGTGRVAWRGRTGLAAGAGMERGWGGGMKLALAMGGPTVCFHCRSRAGVGTCGGTTGTSRSRLRH